MCGVSGVELLVIIVAAIIILGPDKLPELMRQAGRLARDVRKMRGQLGDMTKELRSQVKVEDFTKDLGVDRVRERVKEAESEIDAIRARLNKKIELPDQSGTESSTTKNDAADADADGEGTDSDRPALPDPTTAHVPPTAAPGGDLALGASIEPPQLRPAEGSISRDPSPVPRSAPAPEPAASAPVDDAPAETQTTKPNYRIRSNAYGAPELVEVPTDDEPEGDA